MALNSPTSRRQARILRSFSGTNLYDGATMAITWRHDLDAALTDAQRAGGNKELAVLLDFTAAPM